MIHRDWRWITRFDLSDDKWALLEPLTPKSRRSARSDHRRIVIAIFCVLRTGIPLTNIGITILLCCTTWPLQRRRCGRVRTLALGATTDCLNAKRSACC